jgi:hypothetical protein
MAGSPRTVDAPQLGYLLPTSDHSCRDYSRSLATRPTVHRVHRTVPVRCRSCLLNTRVAGSLGRRPDHDAELGGVCTRAAWSASRFCPSPRALNRYPTSLTTSFKEDWSAIRAQ